MYVIELSSRSAGFLKKLDKPIRHRLEERLKRLKDNPFPTDAKFIRRENQDKIFRYRIGQHRALYMVKESEKVVLIVKIDKRPKVYLRFKATLKEY